MGITGLIGFLKNKNENVSAVRPGHLAEFRGKIAAVDAYSWLHKGVFSCAQDLFLGKPTTRHIDYCLKNISLLKSFGIKPILVFDGGRMPFKIVEAKRREDRQNAKKKANDLIGLGRIHESYNLMVQAIDVTHEMASNLIKASRAIGVESIVAPYEADSQLAYLLKEGYADFVITEDSDLIIFGCDKLFFKMNSTGAGEIYSKRNLEESLKSKNVKFSSFRFEKFRHAAILSGCDYVKNLPGIGLVKAWKFINLTDNPDIRKFLKKIPSYLKLPVTIDDEYINSFIMADLAFQYQIVFDPKMKKRVPLNKVEDVNNDDYNTFLSCFKENELDAYQLALGNIDNKNRSYDQFNPTNMVCSIYSQMYTQIEEPKPEMKVLCGFNTEGSYKKANTSMKRVLEIDNNSQDSSDNLLEMYGNLDFEDHKVEFKEEVEPPVKKLRKCKFLKYNTATVYESKYFNKEKVKEETETEGEAVVSSQPENPIQPASPDSKITLETETFFEPVKKSIELPEESNSNCTHLNSPETENLSQKENVPSHSMEVEEENTKLSPIIKQKEHLKKLTKIGKVDTKFKELQNASTKPHGKQNKVTKGQQSILGFFKKI